MKIKTFLLLSLSLTIPHIFSNEWKELIQQFQTNMHINTHQLLTKQYDEFVSETSPAIASPIIQKIPIHECLEPLIDINNMHHDRISMMEGDFLIKAHTYKEDIDQRGEKYSFVRTSVYQALCCMITELDNLAPHFGYESGDLEIKIFEGLRDLATQKQLFDKKFTLIKSKNPELSDAQVYQETCKWLSPYINNIPTHATGAAVDIALYNRKNQQFLNMGRFNKGGNGSATFSQQPQVSLEQKKNRLLLVIAATNAGLTNYLNEFWHFSHGDRYDVYWRESNPEKQIAKYNAI